MEPGANQTAERTKSSQMRRDLCKKRRSDRHGLHINALICGLRKVRYPKLLHPIHCSGAEARMSVRRLGRLRLRCGDSKRPRTCGREELSIVKLRVEIGFYEYHRWAVDPGAAVTTAMVESLRSGHLFSSVAPYDGQDQSDYLLTGRLREARRN